MLIEQGYCDESSIASPHKPPQRSIMSVTSVDIGISPIIICRNWDACCTCYGRGGCSSCSLHFFSASPTSDLVQCPWLSKLHSEQPCKIQSTTFVYTLYLHLLRKSKMETSTSLNKKVNFQRSKNSALKTISLQLVFNRHDPTFGVFLSQLSFINH